MTSPIAMYIVLRKDLLTSLNWPLGAVITQACHATTAVMWENRDDPEVQTYMSEIDTMRKVCLQIEGGEKLVELSSRLKAAGVQHKLWVEQPENIPVCLAVKPYPKVSVSQHFKGLQLFT